MSVYPEGRLTSATLSGSPGEQGFESRSSRTGPWMGVKELRVGCTSKSRPTHLQGPRFSSHVFRVGVDLSPPQSSKFKCKSCKDNRRSWIRAHAEFPLERAAHRGPRERGEQVLRHTRRDPLPSFHRVLLHACRYGHTSGEGEVGSSLPRSVPLFISLGVNVFV